MSQVGNSRRIPHFLSAGSAMGLQRAMLLNNLKFGTEFSYFGIQKDGPKWIAWYYKVAETNSTLLAADISKGSVNV